MDPLLHAWAARSGKTRSLALDMPTPLGALVPAAEPGILLLAGPHGVGALEAASGAFPPFAYPIAHLPHLAFNDGKTDRAGRLWLGTLERSETEPRGMLFLLHPAAGFRVADAGFTVCNGPAVSPDGQTPYFSDSMGRRIPAYRLDGDGALTERRVFASMGDEDGLPDGLTVDAAGGVWVAHWGGGRVTRFDAEGKMERVVRLPAPNLTSCAFGSSDLETLFVTSAREGLGGDALREAPLSGALFALRPGVPGIAEVPFALPPAASPQ